MHHIWALAFVATLSGLSFSLSSAWAGKSDLVLPCYTAVKGDPNRTSKGNFLRDCELVKEESQVAIKKRIQVQVDQYYQGCDYDPLAPAPKDSQQCQGKPVQRETCNILTNGVPGTFNKNRVETETNHLGFQCGLYTKFSASLSGATCKVQPDRTGANAQREAAYNKGAWIQSINCHYQQIRNEIDRGALKLTPAGDEEGPCSILSQTFDEKKRSTDQLNQTLKAELGQDNMIEDIEKCKGGENPVAGSQNQDPGQLRQRGCQLAAARAGLEAMFGQIAVCEVFYRAQGSYFKFLGFVPGKDKIAEEVLSSLNDDKCKSKNKSFCSGEAIQKNCYLPRYLKIFHETGARYWNAEVCK